MKKRFEKVCATLFRAFIVASLWHQVREKTVADLAGRNETQMNSFLKFTSYRVIVHVLRSIATKRTMIGTSKFSSFIFLDMETTGLQKPVEITEISMIAVQRKLILKSSETKTIPRILDKFTACVRPAKEIECFASSMTGLSNEDLENRKGFDIELGKMVQSFVMRQPQPACLIAHNGDTFDFRILVSHLQTVGLRLPDSVECSDSLKAFRKQHMENEEDSNCVDGVISRGKRKRFSHSLTNLYHTFVGGEFENAHRAEGDALALLKLVIHKPDVLEYIENGAHKLFCHQSSKWRKLDEDRKAGFG